MAGLDKTPYPHPVRTDDFDKRIHANPDWHKYGEALGLPDTPEDVSTVAAAIGEAPAPARADHVHYADPLGFQGAQGAQGAAGAQGNQGSQGAQGAQGSAAPNAVLAFQGAVSLDTGATNYSLIIVSATETDAQFMAPRAGTIANLFCTLNGTPGAGKQYAFTVREDASDTILTCTVADTNTSASDTSNSFVVAAGALISLKSVPTGTPTARRVAWSVTYAS